jgi:hypothetical protein
MHDNRARIPQKRTRSRPTAKKPAAKKTAKPQAVAEAALDLAGVVNLAAHRQRRLGAAQAVEIFALVEWIAPARESWRRGELEVRRSACMPMLALPQADGTLSLSDLPGQGNALVLDAESLAGLRAEAGARLVRMIPGMRVILNAEGLAPALPPMPKPAQILAFPSKR